MVGAAPRVAASKMAMPEVLNSVELLDQDGTPVASREVLGPLPADSERRAIYAARFPEVGAEDTLVALRCEGGSGTLEHIVRLRGEEATALMGECKVSYEDLPPTALVEYRFSTDDAKPDWRLSHVSLPMLISYRKGKFNDWEKRFLEPTCKAELRRMYAVGPVYSVYDHHMFPSDPAAMARFEFTNDEGRKVTLPRPVHALRVWSSAAQAYEPVEAALEGAPAAAEQPAYWARLNERLAEVLGADEYAALAAGGADES